MRVFLIGYHGTIGGASTECLHTIKLWRKYGVHVEAVPTWGKPDGALLAEMDAIGVVTHIVPPSAVAKIPLIEGSPCVSFCNDQFFKAVPALRKIGCPLIWSPCMTWFGDEERECLKANGPWDAVHFQSNFQRDCLEPHLSEFGCKPESGHLIRGAFDPSDWDCSPLPHTKHEPFVLGKIARSDSDKWSASLWDIYRKVLYREKKALVMGLTALGARKLGNLPAWAEWRKPNDMPVREYYGQIHCMLTVNGGAAENWPRVGLEAFAAGVPVVAENRWGWMEMIEHGVTGFLGDTDEELAFYASMLAYDEPLRLNIVRQARERLESTLARPDAIWAGWKAIFTSLGA